MMDVLRSLKEHKMGGIIGNVVLPTQGAEKALVYLVILYKTILTMYLMGTLAVIFSVLFSFSVHKQAAILLEIVRLCPRKPPDWY